MKWPMALRLLCLTLAWTTASLSLAGAEDKASLKLVVELVDGSRMVGTSKLETIAVHNPSYGKVDIRLKRVAAMEFEEDHKTVKVSFLNGDQLSGAIHLDALNLETLFGKVAIPINHVVRIGSALTFVPPGAKFSGRSGLVTANRGDCCFDDFKITTSSGQVIFEDDFNDGKPDGWWLGFAHDSTPGGGSVAGNWRVEEGQFLQTKTGDNIMALVEDRSFASQVIETRLKMTDGYGGITLWYSGVNKWTSVVIHPSQSKVFVLAHSKPDYALGLIERAYGYPLPAAYDTWYTLKVEAKGDTGKLTVYVDGKKICTHDVTAPPEPEEWPPHLEGYGPLFFGPPRS